MTCGFVGSPNFRLTGWLGSWLELQCDAGHMESYGACCRGVLGRLADGPVGANAHGEAVPFDCADAEHWAGAVLGGVADQDAAGDAPGLDARSLRVAVGGLAPVAILGSVSSAMKARRLTR